VTLEASAVNGYTVRDDDDDDPELLIVRTGEVVDTWRENYPYDERMKRDEYEQEKRLLQIELLKLQKWSQGNGLRHLIVFEGRDAAGKGGTIKRFTEHLNPRGARVVALEKPTERERSQWYFQRYVNHLPAAGEIVLFDRSWYNRAREDPVVFPALRRAPPGRRRDGPVRPKLVQPRRCRAGDGVLQPEQHAEFIRQAPLFEQMLVNDGISLTKLWFSVTKAEQRTRFTIRQVDPVRQWKLSPTDLASLDKWGDYTAAKEDMFAWTDTEIAPWTVVKSNDKKRARINAMRHILGKFEYDNKDHEVVGHADPLIVGRALAD
jgi:polyphosphate kinase 2 (PPK2 family)